MTEETLRDLLGGGAAADEVLRNPGVRAALPRGPMAVHAALVKARRGRAADRTRAALTSLLARRRVFAEAADKAPDMTTVNGVGTVLYGKSEADPSDGTYLATLYVTFFFLPVFPRSCWLVSDAPEKRGFFGSRQSWYFSAKVPFSDLHRIWRSTGFAAAAVVAAFAAYASLHWSTHSGVGFVNGLDVAVEVTAGGVTETVPPGEVRTRELASGRTHFAARAGGRTIEEFDADVPGGENCVIYNVLGAGPVYEEGVVYSRKPAAGQSDTPPPLVDVSGESFVVRGGVDDAFTSPPPSIDFYKSDPPRKTRRHVAVAEGGWRTAVRSALNRGDVARAVGIARRVADAEPGDAEALRFAAACLENAGDMAAYVEFAEWLVARHPESIDVHRTYQQTMEDVGRGEEVRTKYRAAYDADRDSARAGYLYARIAPFAEGTQIFERLIRLHPDDASLLRALSWTYMHQRRFADALLRIERFEAAAPAERPSIVVYHAQALAALGRTAEAQRVVKPFIAKGEWNALLLYAKLARLPGADASMPAPSTFFALVAGVADPPVESLLAEQASLLRDAAAFEAHKGAVQGDEYREACELRILAFSDPERGARRAERASKEAMDHLEDESRLALACELDRLGRGDAARAVHAAASKSVRRYVPFERIHALPSLDGLPEDVELELRAILEVAASRRTSGDEQAAWLEAARRDDILRCIVPR